MQNDDLKALLNNIQSAVNNDAVSGNNITTYALSDEAFTEEVLDVLSENLKGYKDVRIDGSNLVLTHADK
ncbi:hypothetical protein [Moritella sp. F3]|uniref:hypothetical protein n=1 Tax=Moritella sp. F3 TaxID=2718882 RepID=UPI0018E1CCA7|nr:hypothetical protein [Moritella sp. F3]GIC75734.1 hypothetical protein FMO001_04610 [Moritella sp. F1]GIC81818.1 hypothetical protein FMO003_20990 [Moritella sp. F3]